MTAASKTQLARLNICRDWAKSLIKQKYDRNLQKHNLQGRKLRGLSVVGDTLGLFLILWPFCSETILSKAITFWENAFWFFYFLKQSKKFTVRAVQFLVWQNDLDIAPKQSFDLLHYCIIANFLMNRCQVLNIILYFFSWKKSILMTYINRKKLGYLHLL